MRKHKFQRTRHGVVIPLDLYRDTILFLIAVDVWERENVRLESSKVGKVLAYRRYRRAKNLYKLMSSCPEGVWKIAPRSYPVMGWYSGEEGLIR